MPQPQQQPSLTQTSGSWTPELLVAGEAIAGLVYASRSGSWVKTGKELRLDFNVEISDKGAPPSTGYISVGGWATSLGAASADSRAAGAVQECILDVSELPGEYFGLSVAAGGSEIRLRRMQGGSYQDALAVNLTDASVIAGSITIIQ